MLSGNTIVLFQTRKLHGMLVNRTITHKAACGSRVMLFNMLILYNNILTIRSIAFSVPDKIGKELTAMANIKVNIAENDLKTLKANKYNLCLAFREKSIGFDVVCIGADDYSSSNTFKVGNEYAVFFCKSLTNGETVDVASEVQSIELGQQITINRYGVFENPVEGKYADRLEIVNNYGNIFPGFGRKVKYGADESMRFAFVSPYVSVKGTFTMEPENVVRVWFQQFADTGTYFTDYIDKNRMSGTSTYAEAVIDCSAGADTVLLTYADGKWQKNN